MRAVGCLLAGLVWIFAAPASSATGGTQLAASVPKTVAFLGLRLQNDNETLEPTTASETNRIAKIENAFRERLDASESYRVLDTPAVIASKISQGQDPGACGGCEVAYAREIGGELVAWMTIQKVSNLILNMNLYLGDVAANKMILVRSVDIRGNTDESWTRSLNYLLDNYVLNDPASQ